MLRQRARERARELSDCDARAHKVALKGGPQIYVDQFRGILVWNYSDALHLGIETRNSEQATRFVLCLHSFSE